MFLVNVLNTTYNFTDLKGLESVISHNNQCGGETLDPWNRVRHSVSVIMISRRVLLISCKLVPNYFLIM
jgi:hypothetical protein